MNSQRRSELPLGHRYHAPLGSVANAGCAVRKKKKTCESHQDALLTTSRSNGRTDGPIDSLPARLSGHFVVL